MRLGLVGSGPQADRYASLRNGGQNVVARVKGHVGASEYRTFLDSVDAVIVATHPAGHRDLALTAIEAQKPVLCEKPLALTREHCNEIIGTAEHLRVPLEVAHTRLWSRQWNPIRAEVNEAAAVVMYREHQRDYSVWIDWAPHAIACLADAMPDARAELLRASVSISESDRNDFAVWGYAWHFNPSSEAVPPMLLMLRRFINANHLSLKEAPLFWKERYAFNRRVYDALFDESPRAGRSLLKKEEY